MTGSQLIYNVLSCFKLVVELHSELKFVSKTVGTKRRRHACNCSWHNFTLCMSGILCAFFLVFSFFLFFFLYDCVGFLFFFFVFFTFSTKWEGERYCFYIFLKHFFNDLVLNLHCWYMYIWAVYTLVWTIIWQIKISTVFKFKHRFLWTLMVNIKWKLLNIPI